MKSLSSILAWDIISNIFDFCFLWWILLVFRSKNQKISDNHFSIIFIIKHVHFFQEFITYYAFVFFRKILKRLTLTKFSKLIFKDKRFFIVLCTFKFIILIYLLLNHSIFRLAHLYFLFIPQLLIIFIKNNSFKRHTREFFQTLYMIFNSTDESLMFLNFRLIIIIYIIWFLFVHSNFIIYEKTFYRIVWFRHDS